VHPLTTLGSILRLLVLRRYQDYGSALSSARVSVSFVSALEEKPYYFFFFTGKAPCLRFYPSFFQVSRSSGRASSCPRGGQSSAAKVSLFQTRNFFLDLYSFLHFYDGRVLVAFPVQIIRHLVPSCFHPFEGVRAVVALASVDLWSATVAIGPARSCLALPFSPRRLHGNDFGLRISVFSIARPVHLAVGTLPPPLSIVTLCRLICSTALDASSKSDRSLSGCFPLSLWSRYDFSARVRSMGPRMYRLPPPVRLPPRILRPSPGLSYVHGSFDCPVPIFSCVLPAA